MALFDAGFWQGAGATFLTGGLSVLGAKLRGRQSRQAQLEQLQNTIMVQVREENKDLRAEVAECRKRDGEVVILKTCFQLVMPEFVRLAPRNPVLAQVGGLLNEAFGAPDHTLSEVRELLDELRKEPGTVFDTTEAPKGNGDG